MIENTIAWSTTISALAAVGILALEILSHRWIRRQRTPKPQIINGDVVWQNRDKDRWNFVLVAENPGEVPVSIQDIAVVVNGKTQTVKCPACGLHIKRGKAAVAEDTKVIAGRSITFIAFYVDGVMNKAGSMEGVRFEISYRSSSGVGSYVSESFSLLRGRTERTFTLVATAAMQKPRRRMTPIRLS